MLGHPSGPPDPSWGWCSKAREEAKAREVQELRGCCVTPRAEVVVCLEGVLSTVPGEPGCLLNQSKCNTRH